MKDRNWYRQTRWDPEIEAAFRAKLRRARNRAQYLQIQGCHLAEVEPEVALGLLEECLQLDDDLSQAPALVCQAHANIALGRIDQAVLCHERALAQEARFPGIRTNAYLELALLIANRSRRELFGRALEVLQERKSRPFFPLEHFNYHAARAIILGQSGQPEESREEARLALEWADVKDVGLRHGREAIGLVGRDQLGMVKRLQGLASGSLAGKVSRALARMLGRRTLR